MARLSLAFLALAVCIPVAYAAIADLQQTIASLRGGNGSFSPQNAAKAAAVVSLATGSATALLPASSLTVMGMPQTPPLQASMRRLGTSLLSFALLGWGTLVKNYSTNQAIALACAPWMADFITILLMDDEDRKGHPMKAEYLGLFLTLLTSYAAYTEAAYMKLVFTLNAGWLAAFGLFFRYSPEPTKFSKKVDDAFKFLNTMLGSCLLGLAACEEALAYDAGILKAIACCTGLFALGGVTTILVEKESDELNIPKFPRFAWILIFGGIAASTFLGSSGNGGSN